MSVARIVLLGLMVGALTLFAIANGLPVSLVFLGTKTPALPLAVWIGGALALGALTSFLLQFLSYLPRNYPSRSRSNFREIPRRSRSFSREIPQPEEPELEYSQPPPPEKSRRKPASDWEESYSENWDFEEQVETDDSREQDIEKDYPRDQRVAQPKSYETSKQPKASSQDGSVYSYSYRDPTESGAGKTEVVYDANYRVITPPYQPPAEVEEVEKDGEDWGFEEDEEFNQEVEKQQKPK
ncbi:MAG: LapA family protein [Coleofasciculaceae cyanobacterium]